MKTLDLAPIKSLFESELLLEIEKVGIHKKIPQGELMIDLGEKVQFIPLILEGAIKVVREDESGDELLLVFCRVWQYLRHDVKLLFRSF